MAITLNGTTGITTPDLTSAAPMDVGGSAVLTTASTVATSALPAGSVIQVVSRTQILNFSTTSAGTYVDTGITGVTITPSSATSKILLIARMPTYTSRYGYSIQVKRNGTPIYLPGSNFEKYIDSGANANYRSIWNLNIVDSPASTSACTYTFFMSAYDGTQGCGENIYTSFFTLMEIAG